MDVKEMLEKAPLLMDNLKQLEELGFKREPEFSLRNPSWSRGHIRLTLTDDLEWDAEDERYDMHSNRKLPVQALEGLRNTARREADVYSRRAAECTGVVNFVEGLLKPSQPEVDGFIVRVFRGRAIPQDCSRRIDELESDGWTLVETNSDYLAWARGTVLKTLRYEEGSGWIWGTHENPFSKEDMK